MNIITTLIGGGSVAAVLLFLQFLIGRADGKKEKRDEIKNTVLKLCDKVDDLEEKIDRRDALNARRAVLRFGDELYNCVHHSKEMYDQILDEADSYDKYCDDHPDFKNSKTVETVKYIKDMYQELYSEHKFM